jgi:hypothetical protein
MSSSLATSLPWAHIQTYQGLLKNHDTQLSMIFKLKDDGILDQSEVETKVSKNLIQFNDSVTKTLRENNLISSESEKTKHKMEIIVKEVLKLQNTVV